MGRPPTGRRLSSTGPSDGPATILTWGLLGPGKGIEWALDAVAGLGDLDPAPRYLIAGETHPRVLERQGNGVPGRPGGAGRRARHR